MAHGLLYGASFTDGVLYFTDKQGRTICNVYLRDYLTLTATKDNSSVALIKVGTLLNEFEVNVGNGWTAYEFGTVIPLNSGESCGWRCSAHPTMQRGSDYVKFVMSGSIKASGNCNSMLNSDFENLTSLTGYYYAFCKMFEDCAALTQAPELPATVLVESCYAYMFSGCTGLTKAPSLPAKDLDMLCYNAMFRGCTGLTKAPSLPATNLLGACYYQMFYGCESLNEILVSATKITAYQCMDSWLYGVSSTGNFYCDPSVEYPTGVSGIPEGWTRLPLSDYPN